MHPKDSLENWLMILSFAREDYAKNPDSGIARLSVMQAENKVNELVRKIYHVRSERKTKD